MIKLFGIKKLYIVILLCAYVLMFVNNIIAQQSSVISASFDYKTPGTALQIDYKYKDFTNQVNKQSQQSSNTYGGTLQYSVFLANDLRVGINGSIIATGKYKEDLLQEYNIALKPSFAAGFFGEYDLITNNRFNMFIFGGVLYSMRSIRYSNTTDKYGGLNASQTYQYKTTVSDTIELDINKACMTLFKNKVTSGVNYDSIGIDRLSGYINNGSELNCNYRTNGYSIDYASQAVTIYTIGANNQLNNTSGNHPSEFIDINFNNLNVNLISYFTGIGMNLYVSQNIALLLKTGYYGINETIVNIPVNSYSVDLDKVVLHISGNSLAVNVGLQYVFREEKTSRFSPRNRSRRV